MMIQKKADDMSEPKTLKVSLPKKMYLQLHQLKLLSGTNISDTVQAALEDYFAEMRQEQDAEQAEAA